MKKYALLLYPLTAAALLMLSACITSTTIQQPYRPESDPAYVSPQQYEGYNCKQLHSEMNRVSAEIDQSVKQDNTQHALDTALSAYALAKGQGYTPPPEQRNDSVDLRRLKNEYGVIEQTAIEKQCITYN